MADYVVDENVWINANKDLETEMNTEAEARCFRACLNWISNLARSRDRLVVDTDRVILTRYHEKIPRGTLVDIILRRFYTEEDRLVFVKIRFEEDNREKPALIPIEFDDREDRKFIALVLAHSPMPTIINSTDTDWEKQRNLLVNYGIIVHELCPDYIREKLTQK